MYICRSNELDKVPKLRTFSAIGERHQGGELSRWAHHTPLFDDVLVLSYLIFLKHFQRLIVQVDITVKRIAVEVAWNWVGMRKIKGVCRTIPSVKSDKAIWSHIPRISRSSAPGDGAILIVCRRDAQHAKRRLWQSGQPNGFQVVD